MDSIIENCIYDQIDRIEDLKKFIMSFQDLGFEGSKERKELQDKINMSMSYMIPECIDAIIYDLKEELDMCNRMNQ